MNWIFLEAISADSLASYGNFLSPWFTLFRALPGWETQWTRCHGSDPCSPRSLAAWHTLHVQTHTCHSSFFNAMFVHDKDYVTCHSSFFNGMFVHDIDYVRKKFNSENWHSHTFFSLKTSSIFSFFPLKLPVYLIKYLVFRWEVFITKKDK